MTMSSFTAQVLRSPTLEHKSLSDLCEAFVSGSCQDSECHLDHELYCVDDNASDPAPSILSTPSNYLSFEPRARLSVEHVFDEDGPGVFSKLGPRHDNDQVEVQAIRILPTTDEILSLRPCYMPTHNNAGSHSVSSGALRLIEKCFRQLRYDCTNGIIVTCYHVMQQLATRHETEAYCDYDYKQETPCGVRYSLFWKVAFEDLLFHETKGVILRISFECPRNLQGRRIHHSGLLEDGMLVGLIGLNKNDKVISTTFFEVHLRESTDSMRIRTGTNTRASLQLSFADRNDLESVRNMSYYLYGLLEASFALVDFPGALLAGFAPHLQRLQKMAHWPVVAFDAHIAPLDPTAEHVVSPPAYARGSGFRYDLSKIRSQHSTTSRDGLCLYPMQDSISELQPESILRTLVSETTLDRGQAVALYESLSRGLAFTQGPPGTGKSFLGVSLVQVILDSQDKSNPKPILAVCMTNHALDSFLADLLEKGITKIARLGGGSKQNWTKKYQLRELCSKLKLTHIERKRLRETSAQVETLTRVGIGWSDSLKDDRLGWYPLRDHLKKSHRHIFDQFSTLERIDGDITDLRRAKRYSGFAYDFWLDGGDIKDLDGLLEMVNTLLRDCSLSQESNSSSSNEFRERVLAGVKRNALDITLVNEGNIWALSIAERHTLVADWIRQLNPWKVCDAIAEVHRRHQSAVNRRKLAHQAINARCLAHQEVIGLTTSGCASNWDLLNQLELRVAIVEEAGEVLEAHSLVTLGLHSLVHFVSIGDPQQLRPQVNEVALSMEHSSGLKYRLDESLFERLMFPSIEGAPPIPTSRLFIQRRMHPDIADISRATLYPYLIDHESTAHHSQVVGMTDRLYWLDHRQLEDCPDPRSPLAKSQSNQYEVEMIAGLVQYLIELGGYSMGEVAVLTPYNGQLALLTRRLRTTCSIWLSEKDREMLIDQCLLSENEIPSMAKIDVDLGSMLRIATIDNFQGEEAKVVIFSAVRSNHYGRVGFLSTINRVNVACSRARDGFYVIGNAALMASVHVWSNIIEVFKNKGKIGSSFRVCCSRHPDRIFEIYRPEQFYEVPACQFPCMEPLPCGHACSYNCHSPSIHQLMPCIVRCENFHPCGHRCEKSCGIPCGPCTFKLPPIILPCGHEHRPECDGTLTSVKVKCQHPVDNVLLPCGHSVSVLCSSTNDELVCQAPCGTTLSCGHDCLMSCAACLKSSGHPKCQSLCGIELGCGHRCAARCGHTGSCPPCREPCQKSCQHGKCDKVCGRLCNPCLLPCGWDCEHKGSCQTCCSLPCDRIPCSEPCSRSLTCGQHLCPSLCGEICPIRCVQCTSGSSLDQPQIFLPCGHYFSVQILDTQIGIHDLYRVNTEGVIVSGSVNSILGSGLLVCPECAVPLTGVRRYSIISQLAKLPDVTDRLYALMGRKLDRFSHDIYRNEELLSITFKSFCKRLSTGVGPLSGKRDRDMIWTRGNAMLEIQTKVTKFRDEVVIPFENSLSRLTIFLDNSDILEKKALPFKPRFHFLYYRCRAITLSDALRLYLYMRDLDQTYPHIAIITEGLRIKVSEQAIENASVLETSITDSEGLNLKRLEAELRLLQIFFHIIAFNLNNETSLNTSAAFQKITKLCRQYPDTAGLLSQTSRSMKAYCNNGGRHAAVVSSPNGNHHRLSVPNSWTSLELKELWKGWGSHKTGHLVYCSNKHPYSSATFKDCPECGREVLAPVARPAIDYNAFLHEDRFLEAMRLR